MPVVPADVLANIKSIYLNQIHNTTTRLQKITGTTNVDNHPGYSVDTVNTLAVYIGFKCSIYHILSGKVNRVFKERDPANFLAELGIFTEDVYCVNFVTGQIIAKEGFPLITILADLKEDEQVEILGKWWKVRKVIPDSEGIQVQVLCVK